MLPIQPSTPSTTETPSFLQWGLSHIYSNPLVGRITSNWKTLLMDGSTITTITCFVISFLSGNTFLLATFGFLAVTSGVGSFYMRRFATLSDLEDTTAGLKKAKEHFEGLAKNFESENNRLSESNRNLQNNIDHFRTNNETLSETNRDLQRTNELFHTNNQSLSDANRELQLHNARFRTNNESLVQANAQLTLQVTQLRESAEEIRSQVTRLQTENSQFNVNIGSLNNQIESSRALCDQIAAHLSTQERGLGEQLKTLETYLAELRHTGALQEKIQALTAIEDKAKNANEELIKIQLQYAAERGKLEAVQASLSTTQASLSKTADKLDEAIEAARKDINANNEDFRQKIQALEAERTRLAQILSPGMTVSTNVPIHVV